MRPDRLNLTKTLVANDQERLPRRRRAELGGVDLLVGAIHAAAQHSHEHATPSRDVLQARHGQFGQMQRIRLAWDDGDGLHAALLDVASLGGLRWRTPRGTTTRRRVST